MFSLLRHLRARLKYRHHERDLAREIEIHRAMAQQDLEARGLSAVDARQAAARALGNTTYMREEARSVWIARWMETTWQDVRYATRQIRRFPAYSVGATIVLALGVSTTTVAFSGLNATLLRPWPVDDADQLIVIKTLPSLDGQFSPTTASEARYLRTHATTVSYIATYMRGGAVFQEPRADVQSAAVSASYFAALGVRVSQGRLFDESDEQPGASPIGLISHRLWETAFARDPRIVGRTVRVMNTPLTIVGVMEPGFEDVHRQRIDLWVPQGSHQATVAPHLRTDDDLTRPVNIVARLAPGVTRTAAAAELQELSRQFRRANGLAPSDVTVGDTRPISDPGSRQDLQPFLLLFPALCLVLLLVCANVGGLILARTSARQREFAVRVALGANRRRVARQVFTEVLLLALGAGAIGVLASRILPHLLGSRLRVEHFAPDGSVLVVAFLLSCGAAVLAASSALLRVRRLHVGGVLAKHHGLDRAGMRARSVLIATQLAVSTIALTGAGLVSRAVVHASSVEPGFTVGDVEISRFVTGETQSMARRLSLVGEWIQAVNGLGLPSVAFATHPPLTRSYRMAQIRLSGDPPSTRRLLQQRSVSGAYFDVLGIQVVNGRTLSDGRAGEAVVSESAAIRLWPGRSAIGQSLDITNGADITRLTVVGVVKDVATRELGQVEPVVYTDCADGCDLVITRGLGPGGRSSLIGAATQVDRTARVDTQTALQNLAEEGTADLQAAGTVSWIIGGAALAVSLIGAFGVLAYTVEERRREIGIRLALGGRGWQVATSVMAIANRPALWGVGAGVLLAAATATVLRHSVFGLQPLDPLAYGLALCVLGPALVLVSLIPARNATRVDPAITLRCE